MKRVQLDYSDENFTRLVELQKDLGFSTRKELFDNAITILDWMLSETQSGNKVGSLDKNDSFCRVLLPCLKIKKRNDK